MTAADHPAWSVYEAAESCDEHRPTVSRDEIDAPLHGRQWCYCESDGREPCHSYCDTNGAAVFRLKDGQIATVTEWSDTSGHG